MKNNKIIKHGHLIFYLVFMTFFSAILTAQNKETDEYEVLILPSNHWDRLWQMPFEVHRLRMVNMVDHLMEIMESKPGFKYFTFDGQTGDTEIFRSCTAFQSLPSSSWAWTAAPSRKKKRSPFGAVQE